jgi:glutaredoxin-related protein
MVEILNCERIQFGTFDILTDEAVRQGLKEFSSWYALPAAISVSSMFPRYITARTCPYTYGYRIISHDNKTTCESRPTYPQLYVDGALVGGLDLVKELKATDELGSVFPDACKLPTPPPLPADATAAAESAST